MTLAGTKEITESLPCFGSRDMKTINIGYSSPTTSTKKKDLHDCVYDIFQRFWQTNEYIEIDWLLLLLLDEERKEKDGLKDGSLTKISVPEARSLVPKVVLVPGSVSS